MDVAAISVVSSAAVSALTIASTFYGAQRQRSHEAALDFERRIWDRKSSVLSKTIELCLEIIEIEDVDGVHRNPRAVDMSMTLDQLVDTRAEIEAFASANCRSSLTTLIAELEISGVRRDVGRLSRARGIQARKAGPDAEGAELARAEQRQFLALATADFDPDMNVIRRLANNLLVAARESVCSPKV